MLFYRCHLQDVPSLGSFYTIQRTLIYKKKKSVKERKKRGHFRKLLAFSEDICYYIAVT